MDYGNLHLGAVESSREYGLRLRIGEIINSTADQREEWLNALELHVQAISTEDNRQHARARIDGTQVAAWRDCLEFLSVNLTGLGNYDQQFEFVFEYSLPGTVHERPDILLLTDDAVVSFEFKMKASPQVDDDKDDVTQAIRYKEWLENHHDVTKRKELRVETYLVCTARNAAQGFMRGVPILTAANFQDAVSKLIKGRSPCSFTEEWLSSRKTEMPGMLQALGELYREHRLPYLSDVNEECVNSIRRCIREVARKEHRKVLIIIDGAPGSGKTAVGQSVVYKENEGGNANAVYLSGNGPLVEVIGYQINKASGSKHMAENAVQGMKEFKDYCFPSNSKPGRIPEQSILVFDEAQRAWDADKLNRGGITEPDGLLGVGDRIYDERGYAVIVALFGDGQAIYSGEETGLPLWEEALRRHKGWQCAASQISAENMPEIALAHAHDWCHLNDSLRSDFIDCHAWVESAIAKNSVDNMAARDELAKLNRTSMRITITRSAEAAKRQARIAAAGHPGWTYGIIISNHANQKCIQTAFPGWDIGFKGDNVVANGGYGQWFSGGCRDFNKACTVFGCQGLELDCPIVLFGGEFVRVNGAWETRLSERERGKYQNPDVIVENNIRVMLTRARKEMVLLVPDVPMLDETYQYFVDMGMETI